MLLGLCELLNGWDDVLFPLCKHMCVHKRQTRQICEEYKETEVVIIESKIEGIRQINGEQAGLLNKRQRSEKGSSFTNGTNRVERNKSRISQPDKPARKRASRSRGSEVKISRNLSEAPSKKHGGKGGDISDCRDCMKDSPDEHETGADLEQGCRGGGTDDSGETVHDLEKSSCLEELERERD